MSTAILRDGTPVRSSLFDSLVFDIDGFLVGFTLPGIDHEEYEYYTPFNFKKQDRNKNTELAGYYSKSKYQEYIRDVNSTTSTIDSLIKFNFEKVLAVANEQIIISIIDFDAPFNYFYNEKHYTFNLKSTANNAGVRNYLKTIIENFKVIDYKINIDGEVGITIPNNQYGLPGGYFYDKNFGSFVNSLPTTVTDLQKRQLKKILALIIFKIRSIIKDIFPIIASQTHFFDKENPVADGIIDYDDPVNGFTDIEKLLFDLKKNWGYYYFPENAEPTPHRASFDALFTTSSTYNDYKIYYNSLINFYDKCNSTKELEFYPSDQKLQYLLEILLPSALGTLPYSLIIKTIKSYITGQLSEENQRFLVKLIISIQPSHADNFLDLLLEKQVVEGKTERTNFEIIYETLTDARLERISYVNWFVDEQTNRMYFAKAVYELWKVSKYNFEYYPVGVTPETNGRNPAAYFNIHEDEFNINHKIKFFKSSLTFSQKVETSFVDNKIKIVNEDTYTTYYDIGVGSTLPKRTLIGNFHLYHPISLDGYQPNLELCIPLKPIIPAFLFHYVEEFDKLADFDAGISLAVDLTVDALLFYFTGGAGILKDLRYLRYTTEIGEAMNGPLGAINAVEVWRGYSAGSQVFTMTAGELAHINQYLITTTNDPKQREILQKAQIGFLCLLGIGFGSSIYTGIQTTKYANDVLYLIDNLPPGTIPELTAQHILLLQAIVGETAVNLSQFGTRLNNINLGGAANTFAIKYLNVFTKEEKLLFWKQFGSLSDEELALFNGGAEGKFMQNWLDLTRRNIPESENIFFVTNQIKVNTIIRFYDEATIKPILETLKVEKRAVFLETFKDIEYFPKFVNEPDLIKKWFRFYDDLLLREEFKELGENGMIKWCQRYGDISDEAFRNLKIDSKVRFKRLMKFPDATHDIAYFNERRAEMLPPKFAEARDGGYIMTHEIDNFIETELYLNKKLRSSIKGEAGDLIDDVTGFSYDPMGLGHESILEWTENGISSVDFKISQFNKAITRHFKKTDKIPPLDFVVIDYKYFDEISSAVSPNPNYIRNQIDLYINENHGTQLEKLIKLNY